MIREAIYEVTNGRNLNFETAKATMEEIMSGRATPVQIAGFLTALRLKGETVEEITAFARVLCDNCSAVRANRPVFEIVGTGGDEAHTFNISTTAGFVIAAGGAAVAKHGNRSVSSLCGAADCLEALGARIELTAEESEAILERTGMCFMFAPKHHGSMKHAAPVRKELGVRTVFNILGPLSNPAGATSQLMGVYDGALVEPLARVLSNLGVTRGAVVHGYDGLDEITACDKTLVAEIDHGTIRTYDIDPKTFGFAYAAKEELVGGNPEVNASILRAVLDGESGGKRTAVVLNAGMGLYLTGRADTIDAGIRKAEKLIDDGSAKRLLAAFIEATNEAGANE